MARRRTGLRDFVASVTCLTIVLGMLVAIDERVAHRFKAMFGEVSTGGVTAWTDRLRLLVGAIVEAARHQSIENAPLLIFAAAGTLLVGMMLRLRT
jgi:hypothetical protein